jgi:hypothetical protein
MPVGDWWKHSPSLTIPEASTLVVFYAGVCRSPDAGIPALGREKAIPAAGGGFPGDPVLRPHAGLLKARPAPAAADRAWAAAVAARGLVESRRDRTSGQPARRGQRCASTAGVTRLSRIPGGRRGRGAAAHRRRAGGKKTMMWRTGNWRCWRGAVSLTRGVDDCARFLGGSFVLLPWRKRAASPPAPAKLERCVLTRGRPS